MCCLSGACKAGREQDADWVMQASSAQGPRVRSGHKDCRATSIISKWL
jgi:hypothetical protein